MTDTKLRAYLLGRLPEEEAVRLEEQALQQDDVFETLRSVEDDLFDDYARNNMDAEDRARFLERYAGQGDRLAFAQALARRRAGGRILTFSRARWTTGLAAAAVLILAVGTMIVNRDRPRETPVAGQPAAQPGPVAPVPNLVVALTLGTSRSVTGSPLAVAVPSAGTVELRVRLNPADRFDRYALELRSSSDTVVWRGSDLLATEENGELMVRGTLAAAALAPGAYELAVRGARAGVPLEDVGFATLEVRKTP